jgi:hypothetical protein
MGFSEEEKNENAYQGFNYLEKPDLKERHT